MKLQETIQHDPGPSCEFSYDSDDDEYLDSCRIVVYGFQPKLLKHFAKIIRVGGGTRYNSYCAHATHIVVPSYEALGQMLYMHGHPASSNNPSIPVNSQVQNALSHSSFPAPASTFITASSNAIECSDSRSQLLSRLLSRSNSSALSHVGSSQINEFLQNHRDNAHIVRGSWLIECHETKSVAPCPKHEICGSEMQPSISASQKHHQCNSNAATQSIYEPLAFLPSNSSLPHSQRQNNISHSQMTTGKRLHSEAFSTLHLATSSLPSSGEPKQNLFCTEPEPKRVLFFAEMFFSVSFGQGWEEAENAIQQHGGTIIGANQKFDETLHYLVCAYKPIVLPPACTSDTKLVTHAWAIACSKKHRIINPFSHFHFLPLPTPRKRSKLFRSCFFHLTGFEDSEHTKLLAAFKAFGGKYSTDMTRKTTHLVATNATGRKYNKAVQWEIPVVSHAWVYYSIMENQLQSTEQYEI